MVMSLESEFEQIKMTEAIKRTTDIEALQTIAISLVDVNFGMKQQFKDLIKLGWLPEQ